MNASGSHELLQLNASTSTAPHTLDVGDSNGAPLRTTRAADYINQKVPFQGVLKWCPLSMDTLGLSRSPRITALKIKQLDPKIDHASFARVTRASEEDFDP